VRTDLASFSENILPHLSSMLSAFSAQLRIFSTIHDGIKSIREDLMPII
jgi:hypothetical protein